MYFEFNLYSSLLIPFFVQGIVFSVLLFYRGKARDQLSDILLGWLLLFNAIKIAFWMLGFAGWYDTHNQYTSFMFYFPFNNAIWMGPLLYFYFLSLTNANFKFQKIHFPHFILPILFFLLVGLKFLIDFGFNRPFPISEYTQFGTKGPLAELDKSLWLEIITYASFFYYLILTLNSFRQYRIYVKQNFSSTDEIGFDWLRGLLYAVASGVLVFFIFRLMEELLTVQHSYIFDWYSYLALGLIIYYLSVKGYSTSVASALHFEPEYVVEYESLITEKEAWPELENWKIRILEWMEKEKSYLDPGLNLAELAKRLNTSPNILSKLINSGFNQNFNDFINEYRVKAVIEKLKAGEQKNQTLLGIALDSGFNSKATFNRAFKKTTQFSPKEWQAKTF